MAGNRHLENLMTHRIYNFSAGPAVMPLPVLEKAQSEMLSVNGIGMSVMEISHRSKHFGEILASAQQGLRDLLQVPDNFKILFFQGGASLQFSMIPINFLGNDQTADYVITGFWGRKALAEARLCGNVNVIASSEKDGYRSVPEQAELNFSRDARYIHYVANETIEGVEFKYDIDGGGIPVVCDMSSNILSKPVDFDKYDLVYTGDKKILAPAALRSSLSEMKCSKRFLRDCIRFWIIERLRKITRWSTRRIHGRYTWLIWCVNG